MRPLNISGGLSQIATQNPDICMAPQALKAENVDTAVKHRECELSPEAMQGGHFAETGFLATPQ
jgi:hypothetical protein